MQPYCPLAEGPRRAESFERKRERERAPAGGGLASGQGKEDGWGAGGWSWRRKRYGGILPQNLPYLVVFRRLFAFSGSDSVAPRLKDPRTIPPRKRFATHIKTQ